MRENCQKLVQVVYIYFQISELFFYKYFNTYKTESDNSNRHHISEIVLKVGLNTIAITLICRIYVIKLVSDLRQVGGFLRVHQFTLSIKLTATI